MHKSSDSLHPVKSEKLTDDDFIAISLTPATVAEEEEEPLVVVRRTVAKATEEANNVLTVILCSRGASFVFSFFRGR